MAKNHFSFNGIEFDYLTISNGFTLPTWTPISSILVDIPRRAGALRVGKEFRIRTISVPFYFKYSSFAELQEIKETLAKDLLSFGNESFPLVFDIEPDRKYFASIVGELELEENPNIAFGTLTFECENPFKHDIEETLSIIDLEGIVVNDGTVETGFISTAIFSDSATEYVITHTNVNMFVKIIYNFSEGDVLSLDFDTRTITINGVLQMPTLDWVNSQWFKLHTGINAIGATEETSLEFTRKWW